MYLSMTKYALSKDLVGKSTDVFSLGLGMPYVRRVGLTKVYFDCNSENDFSQVEAIKKLLNVRLVHWGDLRLGPRPKAWVS